MKRVHAILHEPASYTVDRNHAVYDPLGITYSYLNGKSEAKSTDDEADSSLQLATGTIFKLLSQLNQIIRTNDVIIINGYNGKVFQLLYLLNFFYRKPIGIDSDTRLRIPQKTLKRLAKKLYLNCIFRNKRIFGLPGGTGTHCKLFEHYGMDKRRIYLMPMMVNNSRFKKAQRKGSFRFLFVGRLIWEKNLPILINAFQTEFANNSNVELLIVGDGPLRNQLTQMARNSTNILFAGPLFGESLLEEYTNASAFILPSVSEQWGLVVNEALSAGLPVIVSDQVGAAHDLVEKPDTGFVFRYDDAADLARKMKEMVENKELYQSFSKNAIDLMTNNWNYDFYRKCLINFIENA